MGFIFVRDPLYSLTVYSNPSSKSVHFSNASSENRFFNLSWLFSSIEEITVLHNSSVLSSDELCGFIMLQPQRSTVRLATITAKDTILFKSAALSNSNFLLYNLGFILLIIPLRVYISTMRTFNISIRIISIFPWSGIFSSA